MTILDQYLIKELTKDLNLFRRNFPQWPQGLCNYVALELEKRYDFKRIRGFFIADSVDPNNGLYNLFLHSFVKDENEIYIDLTACQFNPYLNEPLQDKVLIIDEKHPLRWRYKENQFRVQDFIVI